MSLCTRDLESLDSLNAADRVMVEIRRRGRALELAQSKAMMKPERSREGGLSRVKGDFYVGNLSTLRARLRDYQRIFAGYYF